MVTGSSYSSKNKLIREGGILKIADFGLCKTLPTKDVDKDLNNPDKYKMTGETGTYRYM
jgi:serine/threonine protein kinase